MKSTALVLKVDGHATQQRLGYTGRAPRWANRPTNSRLNRA